MGCLLGGALAERVGFEPTIRFPVYTLSKRAPSATRPSLRRQRGSARRQPASLANSFYCPTVGYGNQLRQRSSKSYLLPIGKPQASAPPVRTPLNPQFRSYHRHLWHLSPA